MESTVSSSSLAEKVKEIKARSRSFGLCEYVMKGLLSGMNDRQSFIYISAPIRREQLDNGTNSSDGILSGGPHRTVQGDRWRPYIPTRLGGNLKYPWMLAPINDKLSLKEWEEDENRVYEYLSSSKQGEDRSVLLEFAIEYNEFFRDELSRPYLIHRIFHFFINGQPGDLKPIEGTFVNTSPRLTHTEVYSPICTQDEFQFIPYIHFVDSAPDSDEDNYDDDL